MEYRSTNEKKMRLTNAIVSGIMVILLFLLFSLNYDFFHDLNDDLVIRDILSGKYTGEPEAHTNQLLYPLALALALGYRVFRDVPIFALFLTGSMMLSLFLIFYRVLGIFRETKGKVIGGSILLLLSGCFLLKEIIFVQYTAVSGILCTASCFWLLTTNYCTGKKKILLNNLPALLIYITAFLLRSEMALLCLPFFLICVMICWIEEVRSRKEKVFFPFLAMVLSIILTFFLFLFLDKMAYQTEAWKEFQRFFDARTRVYDYTWYPSYEEAEEFYQKENISKTQFELIQNYNFGLDDTITEDTLQRIASYNEKTVKSKGVGEKVKLTVKSLFTLPFSKEEIPYSSFVFCGYLMVIGLALVQKKKREYGEKLALLLAARTVCWTYMIWSERLVTRVTHPLYFMEFFILLALVIRELYDRPLWNKEKYYRRIVGAALLMLSLLLFPGRHKEIRIEIVNRENILKKQEQLEEYIKANPWNYYYIDVYSMVDFHAKMYGNTDTEKRNYDFLGGWISKSPLEQKAREEFLGEKISLSDALLTDHFYVIIKEGRDSSFLKKFYENLGISVLVEQQEQIGEEGQLFYVYQVKIEDND